MRVLLLLVAASLLFPEFAAAEVYALARVRRQSASVPACDDLTDLSLVPVDTSCQINGSSGFAPVYGSASAAVAYGSMHTEARLWSANSDGSRWEAAGYAGFTDQLRISSIGRAGESGIAEIRVTTHAPRLTDRGDLTAGTLSAVSELLVLTNGRLRTTLQLTDAVEHQTAAVGFIYGEILDLELGLVSKVTCSSCLGSWEGWTDASESAVIEMIEVRGLGPEEYSVRSELGEVYANVLPEPGSTGLAAVALLTLAALRRSASRFAA